MPSWEGVLILENVESNLKVLQELKLFLNTSKHYSGVKIITIYVPNNLVS